MGLVSHMCAKQMIAKAKGGNTIKRIIEALDILNASDVAKELIELFETDLIVQFIINRYELLKQQDTDVVNHFIEQEGYKDCIEDYKSCIDCDKISSLEEYYNQIKADQSDAVRNTIQQENQLSNENPDEYIQFLENNIHTKINRLEHQAYDIIIDIVEKILNDAPLHCINCDIETEIEFNVKSKELANMDQNDEDYLELYDYVNRLLQKIQNQNCDVCLYYENIIRALNQETDQERKDILTIMKNNYKYSACECYVNYLKEYISADQTKRTELDEKMSLIETCNCSFYFREALKTDQSLLLLLNPLIRKDCDSCDHYNELINVSFKYEKYLKAYSELCIIKQQEPVDEKLQKFLQYVIWTELEKEFPTEYQRDIDEYLANNDISQLFREKETEFYDEKTEFSYLSLIEEYTSPCVVFETYLSRLAIIYDKMIDNVEYIEKVWIKIQSYANICDACTVIEKISVFMFNYSLMMTSDDRFRLLTLTQRECNKISYEILRITRENIHSYHLYKKRNNLIAMRDSILVSTRSNVIDEEIEQLEKELTFLGNPTHQQFDNQEEEYEYLIRNGSSAAIEAYYNNIDGYEKYKETYSEFVNDLIASLENYKNLIEQDSGFYDALNILQDSFTWDGITNDVISSLYSTAFNQMRNEIIDCNTIVKFCSEYITFLNLKYDEVKATIQANQITNIAKHVIDNCKNIDDNKILFITNMFRYLNNHNNYKQNSINHMNQLDTNCLDAIKINITENSEKRKNLTIALKIIQDTFSQNPQNAISELTNLKNITDNIDPELDTIINHLNKSIQDHNNNELSEIYMGYNAINFINTTMNNLKITTTCSGGQTTIQYRSQMKESIGILSLIVANTKPINIHEKIEFLKALQEYDDIVDNFDTATYIRIFEFENKRNVLAIELDDAYQQAIIGIENHRDIDTEYRIIENMLITGNISNISPVYLVSKYNEIRGFIEQANDDTDKFTIDYAICVSTYEDLLNKVKDFNTALINNPLNIILTEELKVHSQLFPKLYNSNTDAYSFEDLLKLATDIHNSHFVYYSFKKELCDSIKVVVNVKSRSSGILNYTQELDEIIKDIENYKKYNEILSKIDIAEVEKVVNGKEITASKYKELKDHVENLKQLKEKFNIGHRL